MYRDVGNIYRGRQRRRARQRPLPRRPAPRRLPPLQGGHPGGQPPAGQRPLLPPDGQRQLHLEPADAATGTSTSARRLAVLQLLVHRRRPRRADHRQPQRHPARRPHARRQALRHHPADSTPGASAPTSSTRAAAPGRPAASPTRTSPAAPTCATSRRPGSRRMPDWFGRRPAHLLRVPLRRRRPGARGAGDQPLRPAGAARGRRPAGARPAGPLRAEQPELRQGDFFSPPRSFVLSAIVRYQ